MNDLTKTIRFKVASYRKIPNPYLTSDNASQKKPEMYMLICDVLNLPDDIPMDTNPREQKLTTNVSKKIRDSLTNHSDLNFYLLNRGLLLSAKSISYNSTKSEVEIVFEDFAYHGNVDGGHTYKIIKENKKFLEPREQFVKIEVVTGIEDMFEQLAAARNTSVQVKDKSIAELEKRFELIKQAFDNEPFYNDINYKEFDTKRIDITDILSILNLFNIDKYDTDSNSSFPINSYSGKKTCTDAYINASKTFEKSPEKNPYVKMMPIMVDIIKIYDFLEAHMSDFYKGNSTGMKKYGAITGVTTHKSGKPPFKSMFYQNKMDYISPKGFLFPILGAFRALVEEKNGVYRWKIAPMKVLKKIGNTLVNVTIDTSRGLGNNPNATGKSQTLWMNLFMCVKMETMQERND